MTIAENMKVTYEEVDKLLYGSALKEATRLSADQGTDGGEE